MKSERMRAVLARKPGGPEVLELREVDLPSPAAGEVLVRLRASGLNHLDIWVREGVAGARHPIIPGCEGAGVVERLGPGVEGLSEGDAVLVAPGYGCGACLDCESGRESYCRSYTMIGYQRAGTYAEAVAVPAGCAIRKPERLTWEEAAAFPLTFLTAWHMLFARGGLRPGETVLVMAAGSGVGQAAVQIARHAGGQVIATAGSEAKREKACDLGAHGTVDYTGPEWFRKVRHLTGGRGADLIVDHTGSDYWPDVLRSLAVGGRVVLCGATTGAEVSLDLRFLFARQQQIIGSYMGSRGELREALRLVESGAATPVVDRSFPLEETRAAQEHLSARAQFGKLVLVP